MKLLPFSVDTIKGYTRATCVAFVALALLEMDVVENEEKIKPLMRVLDRAWMLPMHAPWLELKTKNHCFLSSFWIVHSFMLRLLVLMLCPHWRQN